MRSCDYTKKDILEKINKAITERGIDDFYDSDFFYGSKLKDDKLTVVEFVASYILDNLITETNGECILKNVKLDTRSSTTELDYCTDVRSIKKGKGEERFQRDLYFLNRDPIPFDLAKQIIGEEFIWFELSPKPGNGKGIDLISYNSKRLSIYELKYRSKKENILKAILEIQTYYQRTDFHKFKSGWNKNHKQCCNKDFSFDSIDFDESNIRKVILIDKNTPAARQKDYPLIRRLIEKFNIVEIYFDSKSS